MNTVAAPVLGVVAGALSVVEIMPYIRDTLAGSTRPHRGTWLIWSVLAGIAFWAHRADGASWSLVILAVECVGTSIVFALSVRLGSGTLSRAERGLVALAGIGVLGWLATDEPLVAMACVIASDLVATLLMLPKTWRDPRSETLSTYVLASAGGVAAVASIGAVVPSLLLYPVHFCLLNAAVAGLIALRRAQLDRRPETASTLSCCPTVPSETVAL